MKPELLSKRHFELIIECTYRMPRYCKELERKLKNILKGRKKKEEIEKYLKYRGEMLSYLGTLLNLFSIDPWELWQAEEGSINKGSIRWARTWEHKVRFLSRLLYGEKEDPLPLTEEGKKEIIKVQDELKIELYPLLKSCMLNVGSMDFLLSAYHVTSQLKDSLLQFPHATTEDRREEEDE